MTFLKLFLGVTIITLFVAFSTTQMTGCTKTQTDVVHDTTTITKTDTLTKIDTFHVTDSIYDLRDGLVAYYNFKGSSLNDSSGYGNNITFNNATPAADRFGNA